MLKKNVDLIACPQCDALALEPTVNEGEQLMCRGCGARIFTCKKNSVNRTFAFALAGLILFFPALNLPLINVGMFGLNNQASLADSMYLLIDDFPFIALSLFLFTCAIPLIKLVSALVIAGAIKFKRVHPEMLNFFRSHHWLDSWTMLHVYLLGIIVSMYKLVQMQTMELGVGFVAFVLFLLSSTLVTVVMDHHLFWCKLEHALTNDEG